MTLVPAEACANYRDLTQARHHWDETCRETSHHNQVSRAPLHTTPPHPKHPAARPDTRGDLAPVPQESLPPSAHPICPCRIHQHPTRPPPAISSDRPLPAAASKPMNCRTKPESRKHPREQPTMNRSGQQYPGEIAAGGHATSVTKSSWIVVLMKCPCECVKLKRYEKEESSHNKSYKEVYHNW